MRTTAAGKSSLWRFVFFFFLNYYYFFLKGGCFFFSILTYFWCFGSVFFESQSLNTFFQWFFFWGNVFGPLIFKFIMNYDFFPVFWQIFLIFGGVFCLDS